jgi:integrase
MQPMGRPRTTRLDLPPHMHQKGGMYYYVTTGHPRKWIKLHSDLAKARVLWAQIENGPGGAGGNFATHLDEYLASRRFAELADKTRRQYEFVAGQLREFFSGSTLDIIEPAHVATWMDEHPSKIQANTGKAIISTVFEIACRQGQSRQNPAKLIRYHRITGRDRLITDAEYRAIWKAAEPHVQIAMDIGYLTGARVQDILDIKLQDIEADGVFVKVGKTKKRMLFLWSDGLREVIARAKALPRSIRGMHLICDRQGKPYRYGTFNGHWLDAVRDAKVEAVHFHDIRAKAATDAKAMGMDYQALLGHASKAMSDRYIRQREISKVGALPAMKLAEL